MLTPGRIRVVVGEDVVIDLGCRPEEFLFWLIPDPDRTDEDDDGDLALADFFQKHEADFRRKIEVLRATPREDLRHAEAVLDYLRAHGVFAAQPLQVGPPNEQTDGGRADSGAAGVGWTRPRPVRALFAQVGLPVPSKLGQEEFGALMEALENRGFDVATADGARLTPLHDAVSIDAELRVRHDALAAPPVPLRAATSEGPDSAADRGAAAACDYERAVWRLELLTAGLGPGHASPEQVARCVEIATVGLAVQDVGHVLLGRVGEALARTLRDPLVVLTGLVRRLHAEDGEVLLREYAALHPESDDMHALLSDHWAALCQA